MRAAPTTTTAQPTASNAVSTQLQLRLESTGEGIYGIDNEGCCSFINHAAAAMLGQTRTEAVLGQNMHVLMHHSHANGQHHAKADKCWARRSKLIPNPISPTQPHCISPIL